MKAGSGGRHTEGTDWMVRGRGDERRETETLFQLTSPMSAIRRPGTEMLQEWMNEKRERECQYCIPEAMFAPVSLSACTYASSSDISISQQWVPETLRYLCFHPANQMQRDRGREGGTKTDWGGDEDVEAAVMGVRGVSARERGVCMFDFLGILNEGFCNTSSLTLCCVYFIALQSHFLSNINETLIWTQTKPLGKLVSSLLWSLVVPHICNGWRKLCCWNEPEWSAAGVNYFDQKVSLINVCW